MLDIKFDEEGKILLSGRFDASQVEKAKEFFKSVSETRIVDMANLEYISSAGLGVLLMTQKSLMDSGNSLKFINVNSHIYDIFLYSGFDQVFEIQAKKPG